MTMTGTSAGLPVEKSAAITSTKTPNGWMDAATSAPDGAQALTICQFGLSGCSFAVIQSGTAVFPGSTSRYASNCWFEASAAHHPINSRSPSTFTGRMIFDVLPESLSKMSSDEEEDEDDEEDDDEDEGDESDSESDPSPGGLDDDEMIEEDEPPEESGTEESNEDAPPEDESTEVEDGVGELFEFHGWDELALPDESPEGSGFSTGSPTSSGRYGMGSGVWRSSMAPTATVKRTAASPDSR